jgi:hypothetical protein
MRFSIRKLLCLAAFVALAAAWFYGSWRLSIEKPPDKREMPPPDEAISEYRELLNNLN